MNSYEKWLIKQRIYCEYRMCWNRATHVIKINNRDEVRCENHGHHQQPKQEQKLENKP